MDSGLFQELVLAFVLALLIMPLVDYFTNVLLFRKGLNYEASVVDNVFGKEYEAFLAWQSDQLLGKITMDPLQYRQMAVVTPTRLLADGTVLIVVMTVMLRRNVPLLSGGEIKRIELARLMLCVEKCNLLMLDEPFENLDGEGRELVQEILGYTEKARILVSHEKE